MIAGSTLGNTGNHRNHFLWSPSVMPHNLDTNHPVCKLKTTRYSEGQTLPLTSPSNSLNEFLDPWGQTMVISQSYLLQNGIETLFIPVNQRHLFGYPFVPQKSAALHNLHQRWHCKVTTAAHGALHSPLPRGWWVGLASFSGNPKSLLLLVSRKKLCLSLHVMLGTRRQERSWCNFWSTTRWPGKSARKSKIKNNEIRFLQSTSRWTLAHVLLRKIFLCICCFLLASECNRKLEKLVSAGKRRVQSDLIGTCVYSCTRVDLGRQNLLCLHLHPLMAALSTTTAARRTDTAKSEGQRNKTWGLQNFISNCIFWKRKHKRTCTDTRLPGVLKFKGMNLVHILD